MTQLDKMGYRDTKMTVVQTDQFTAPAPSALLLSEKRFNDAMALHQSNAVPSDTAMVTPVQTPASIADLRLRLQRTMLQQMIQYGVKAEIDEE